MRRLALLLPLALALPALAHPGAHRALRPRLHDGAASRRPAALGEVLVERGSAMRWLANSADPGLGLDWVSPGFDDSGWELGTYGAGYETGSGAVELIDTVVPEGSLSLYTRAEFDVADPAAVLNLLLAADWDDGWAAWINGVEVHRSAEMPAGMLAWNSDPALHESSNGVEPDYWPVVDVSAVGLPALVPGRNVLAVAVWNAGAGSSDLVIAPQLRRDVPERIVRGPYLQLATPDSVIVRWRTAAPTPTQLHVGPAGGSLTRVLSDPVPKLDHEVFVDGLAGGRAWSYLIEDEAGPQVHDFRTPPPTGSREPFRAWVIGDSGTGNDDARAVRDAYLSRHPATDTDLWLLLGDNAYQDGTDGDYQRGFFDVYAELAASVAVWPTLGNHDGHSASSADESGPYYDIFSLPRAGEAGGRPSGTEAWYSFDHGNAHFVCLDSFDSDRLAGGAMMSWLEADLAATDQDWVVAFWHHPPYSKGSHDSDAESALIEMRENAVPILEAAGVDLVLCGHSHSYERSVLLDGHLGVAADFSPAVVVDGGDGDPVGDGEYAKPTPGLAPHEGAVYAVAGSSGKTSDGPLDHPAMIVGLVELGSMILELDGLRLDARFLDAAGVERDAFTIVKGCASPPCFERDCTDGLDDDGDGLDDAEDPDCLEADSDGDGVPDAEDCAPRDPSAWALPPSAAPHFVEGPGSLLRWTDAAPAAGPGTAHDVIGGLVAELHADRGFDSATCRIGAVAGDRVADPEPVGDGVRWSLIRARNACGLSGLGNGWAGERLLPDLPCP